MAIRKLLVGLLVPNFVIASILPEPRRNDTIRIIGGVDAERGDFPYAVSLQLFSEVSHFCTGSLLDTMTVMTVAHCIKSAQEEGFDPSDIFVRVSSLSRMSGGTVLGVRSWATHPDYDAYAHVNDIVILKLSNPVPNDDDIEFAVLASAGSDPKSGSMATAAGWQVMGYTDPVDLVGSEHLQKVDIPIVSRESCAARIHEWAEEYQHDEIKITDAMVCAGYTKNGEYVNDRSPCNGDSGGPLVDTDTGVMVGIVSWAIGSCGTDGYPTVYARVGKLKSFLDKHMG